jgi:O-antigen/teichoic acid export membrane protein
VPIVCLAYLFFSMHEHFKVPAMLANRTVALLPVAVFCATANIAFNLLLIPRGGAMGAAWASVFTFVVFSVAGLFRYRRIDRYDYPFASSAALVGGMVATYVLHRALVVPVPSVTFHAVSAALIWMVWAVVLFRDPARQLMHEIFSRGLIAVRHKRETA